MSVLVASRRSGLRTRGNTFIKGSCMSIYSCRFHFKCTWLLPEPMYGPYPPYCIPFLKLSYSAHQLRCLMQEERTYYFQDIPVHSLSIPILPQLLLRFSLMHHRYSPPYQRPAPTTSPLLDSFELCNLLSGLLLLEYHMRLKGVCFCSSAHQSHPI